MGGDVTWRPHLLIAPLRRGRFHRVEADCRWLGSHRDIHWTPLNHGRVLVGQCTYCRVVVGVVIQRISDDFPGAIE